MTDSPPFDRTDLPRHTRVIGAQIATVYAAVVKVDAWPAWVPDLLDPVIAKGSDRFLVRIRRRGRIEHLECQVIVRGPTHTFGIQVGLDRLWFRTRPSPPGTKLDVVLEPAAVRSLRSSLGSRRRRDRGQQWLVAIVDGLAAHLDDAS